MKDTYFMAIPRTGGTSLHGAVAQYLGTETVQPQYTYDQFVLTPPEEREKYSFYAGHYYDIFHFIVQKPVQFITLLRNPIERTLSHFKYLKATGQTNHETYESFLTDLNWQELMENYQTKSFLLNKDPRFVGSGFISPDPEKMLLEKALDSHRNLIIEGELSLFSKAIRRSKDFFFVGITEEHKLSTRILFKKLGLGEPPPYERRNVLEQEALIIGNASVVEEIIQRITQVDAELWEYYKARLMKIDIEKIEPQVDQDDEDTRSKTLPST